MFGFGSKEVNKTKVISFVDWFIQNEARIRQSVENRESDRQTMYLVLNEVEAELAKIYIDGYKGRIEFDYGGKDEDWELHLYHMNKKFLISATSMIADEFTARGNSIWKVIPLR